MENSNDNSINYDDLTEEEKKLVEIIHHLENSEELKLFIANLKTYASIIGIEEVRDRIKTPKSALDKFREKGYEKATRMSDLAGIMAITDDMDLVYQMKDYIVSKLPKERTEEEDMIKNPKCGYRSYHVNSVLSNFFSDLENVDVPFEAQIKTEAMSIAQDTIHDSLYKKKDMPKEINFQQFYFL